ncbi:MAG: 30S ribosomal protein S12 methylthiotransferase RimO [Oscillospiraceae bacterium]|jgi:ribosomal protein S12 methylthiotransferase
MSNTVALISLGCAKNLVNSEQMMYLLDKAGFSLTGDVSEADAVVINTCGFIDSAVSEAIDSILETASRKLNGYPKIIVAGCLAERFRKSIREEMPEVDAVIGTGGYGEVADVVAAALGGETPEVYPDINAPTEECGRIVSTPPWTAYIKIAEGCDNCCSYCVIPSLRGRFRSRRFEDIVAEAEELVKSGARELIVVAQDITRYGTDNYGRRRLGELIRSLCAIPELHWLRLHYLYPDELDDGLIDVIASEDKVVKYLDIPIQHCNDKILRAMNRRGKKAELLKLFKKLRERIPGVVLRTSLISGLPGEGEQEFLELCEFLREVRLERVGVFPFSPQEGTPAADMPGAADAETVAKRISLINDLQSSIMDEYNESRLGQNLEVLCEGLDPETGLYFGRSFADSPEIDGRVLFSARNAIPGSFVIVKINGAEDGDLTGEALY